MPENNTQLRGQSHYEYDDRYPLIQTLLYDTPLMILPSKADVLHHVLQGYMIGNPPAVDAAAFQSNVQNRPYQVTTGGVAVIPVLGSLTHRAGFLDAASGLMSYRKLHAMLRMAEKDQDVKGVMLEIDSGGGAMSGLFELTDHIKALNAIKPVWSIANDSMYSAAYAIGAVTSKILMQRTAGGGSIGVMMMHLDQSKANEKAGRKYTPIYAGYHKMDGSSIAPLSKDARANYQHIVDDAYGLFTAHVANGRGIDEQVVIDTQAQIYTAPDAIDLGLADQIATFDEALNMLEYEISSSVSLTLASASNQSEKSMTVEIKGAESQFSQADIDAAREQGKAEGLKAGRDEERTRVSAILDHEKSAANFAQAANAIKTGLSVEQATGVLAAMPDVKPAAQGNAFVSAMSALGDPGVAASGGEDAELTDEQLAQQAVSYFQGGK